MKTKNTPGRYATVFRLEQQIYKNAARLFLDACTLYSAEAFPSAYALAILGYEELGKVQMIDHVASEAVLNSGTFRLDSDWMGHLFSRDMFYSHRNKQDWGAYRGAKNGSIPQVERLVESKRLDRHKQDAIYVGFSHSRILLPERFRATHAYRQLKYLLGGFERTADLPFIALFEDSTRSSRRCAKSILVAIRRAFSQLQRPARQKATQRKNRQMSRL